MSTDDDYKQSPELLAMLKRDYSFWRVVDNQGVCGVHRLMFHWTVHVGIDEFSYRDRWCFNTETEALVALAEWDGTGDMFGRWHKHPKSGRRRDPDLNIIWHEDEDTPDAVKLHLATKA